MLYALRYYRSDTFCKDSLKVHLVIAETTGDYSHLPTSLLVVQSVMAATGAMT